MAKVVVVKFKKGCKTYYFEAGKLQLSRGQGVIVETARGIEYATVVEPEREVEEKDLISPLKPVVRIATEKDENTVKRNEERRPQAMETCKEKIRARNLEMKLIDCEFAFDGSKVVFYFTAEGRVDFRDLVKDLASVFHIRIELRQVGIRDETKMLGGIAPCGRECCCAGSMSEFQKVSIKMAKNQGLSLNPGKISGLCGRLMCCLAYENEYYAEAYKKVPKIGGSVGTPEGTATVVSVNMLKMTVKVKIEKDGALCYRDFPVDQITFRKGSGKEKEEAETPEERAAKKLEE
ncbi:MAG: stage 0 sporulation family protein [Clostridia bacterium]|jgi:cell fate regulator YaaT (PSP1 superfamily)|nr:stage 0 sporulation family protein [Clostridia bacterium]